MKCDFCGSIKNKKIFDYTRYIKNDVMECLDCALVFLKNIKNEDESIDHYKHNYRTKSDFPVHTPEELFNNPISLKDTIDRMKWITNHFNHKSASVLEIGSASGHFLDAMKKEGFNVTGIELTQEMVKYSRSLGLRVLDKSLIHLKLDSEFDLIVSFHCLEHISNPTKTFTAIKKALKPNGVFMGEVPNQDDWRISMFDSVLVKRFHYDPNHNFYFSPEMLKNYFKNCGLALKNLETVERYNTLTQLKRILSGENDTHKIESLLNRDIYTTADKDIRINQTHKDKEIYFQKILGDAINKNLLGNCIRWIAKKA